MIKTKQRPVPTNEDIKRPATERKSSSPSVGPHRHVYRRWVHVARRRSWKERLTTQTSVIDEEIIELRASERKWPPFVLGMSAG